MGPGRERRARHAGSEGFPALSHNNGRAVSVRPPSLPPEPCEGLPKAKQTLGLLTAPVPQGQRTCGHTEGTFVAQCFAPSQSTDPTGPSGALSAGRAPSRRMIYQVNILVKNTPPVELLRRLKRPVLLTRGLKSSFYD